MSGRFCSFGSVREGRLWGLSVLAVAGIYSTVGLARPVSSLLRSAGLLEVAFAMGVLLIVIAVAVLAWRRRPNGAEIGVMLGVLAVYVLVFVRMSLPEERTHLIEYGVVAALLYEALSERARHGRGVARPGVAAVFLTGCLGAGDEAIQHVLPDRVFDVRDLFFNALAAFMAVASIAAVRRVRRSQLESPPV